MHNSSSRGNQTYRTNNYRTDNGILEKNYNLKNSFKSPWSKNSFVDNNIAKKMDEARSRRVSVKQNPSDMPRLIHQYADQGGCSFWRMHFPQQIIMSKKKAMVDGMYRITTHPDTFNGVNAIKLQRQCSDEQKRYVEFLKNVSDVQKTKGESGFKILYEIDDIIAPSSFINNYNVAKSGFLDPSIETNMRSIMRNIDEMIVPSQYMADHYSKYLGMPRISIIPNYVPRYLFDFRCDIEGRISSMSKNKKPRVLFAGSATHIDMANLNNRRDDFTHVIQHIVNDIEKDKKYQWCFFGGHPVELAKYVEKGLVEYYPWTDILNYASVYSSIGADVAIAPLADNPFNHAKANIKITEAAAMGIPCIAQNLSCYNSDGWNYLFDTGEQMMEHLANITSSTKSYRQSLENAASYVSRYWLEDHIDEYLSVYLTPYGDSSRKSFSDFYSRNEKQFA